MQHNNDDQPRDYVAIATDRMLDALDMPPHCATMDTTITRRYNGTVLYRHAGTPKGLWLDKYSRRTYTMDSRGVIRRVWIS